MKKTRKIISLILAAALAASMLCACGGKEENKEKNESQLSEIVTASAEETTEEKTEKEETTKEKETTKEEETTKKAESSTAEETTKAEATTAAEKETEADRSGNLSSAIKSIKNIADDAKELFSDNDSKYDISKDKAKDAFEDYGKEMYPEGFKCHWIRKNHKTKHRSDGSWYFKVGVTIKDDDGKKEDATAEGTVYGSNKSPQVKGFKVY